MTYNDNDSFDMAREIFGSRMGSIVADKLTYVPTGTIMKVASYEPFLSMNGARIFPAEQWDWMLDWMRRYDTYASAVFYLAELTF